MSCTKRKSTKLPFTEKSNHCPDDVHRQWSGAQVSAIRPVPGGNRDQEAANTLHILVAHSAINNRTPYELWYVSESVMAHLCPDGCQTHVLFPVSSLEKLTLGRYHASGLGTNRNQRNTHSITSKRQVSQLEKTRSLSLKTLETGIPRRVQMDDRTRTVEPRQNAVNRAKSIHK
ncbi:hypothetical protein BDEG_23803 [Batrachochytrium dendrobatidis JEL423]|uniref:Uncharacterized protein n=1 Tax=Batrachochytrium dendrobatidis (strain JEL423) TaxID=403673 RepID=A0A177WIW9_BATDL|nr:hypothetical protein BDEG_23803 [Batrachochytrium dendrobatidis JEL423]